MRVVRLKPYMRAMDRMGLDDAAMREVEAAILAAPSAHPVVQGLRGVRKMRFARRGTGKSGGGRVLYYVVARGGLLAMLTAYPKNEKDDLTADDRRAILRALETLISGDFV